MSDTLLDRLRADFASKRQKVTILGIDVFVSPLSIAENTKVMAMYPDDSAMRQAAFIVLKCTDEAGKPVFTDEDREALTRSVAGSHFDKVFKVMNGDTVEKQAEK